MNLSLTVLAPKPLLGQKIPINHAPFVIGADSQCQLQIGDAAISPRHCALSIRDQLAYVEDLGSASGTYVNNSRISGELQLHDKDELQVGPLRFAVVFPASSAAVKPAPTSNGPEVEKVFLKVEIPGPMNGKEIPITGSRFTIGRGPQSQLQVENASIAPAHCALTISNTGVSLSDLGSASGTFVNDQRIEAATALRDGDHVKVGPLLFAVRIQWKKKATPTPPRKTAVAGAKDTSAAAGEILKKYLRRKRHANDDADNAESDN